MKVIGLMSGTSADGIDAALCEITGEPPHLRAEILETLFYPYDSHFQQQILDLCLLESSRVDALCQMNFELAQQFAEVTLNLIQKAGLQTDDIDLIGSHGQTVWHNVLPDGRVNATLQIVESAVLAECTGITTISNFRTRDVAAGGQGAPLTAYVDWLLLRHPEKWRAVQNIGGIGNVTFLPPLSDTSNLPVAFDTGPGNALIDGAVFILTAGQQSYDRDGLLAKQGIADEAWLEELLRHPYYQRAIPKTTGREMFGFQIAQQLVEQGRGRGLSPADIIMTLTMLTAVSIADAYARFAPQPIQEVIIGGGGGKNPVLMQVLQSLLPSAHVMTHEDIGMDSDFKEALVFAMLAYETWHHRPGVHPALTGVSKPVVLGQITPGENYPALIRQTWNS